MYLISIYFDEMTNKKIQQHINRVAEKTGNKFMLEGNVPPHITISAFETMKEEEVIDVLECVVRNLKPGKVQWASVGQFFPHVIFLVPVLNEYLHELSVQIYDTLLQVGEIMIHPYYQPFQWLPHTTVAKKMSKDEMQTAFRVMQNNFGMFEGEVVRIGLAKPNPHRDIVTWEFESSHPH